VAFSAHFFAAAECVGNKKANKFRHKQHVRVGSGKKRVRQETAAEMTGQDTGVHRLYTDTNRSEALANRRAGDLCAAKQVTQPVDIHNWCGKPRGKPKSFRSWPITT